MIKNIRLTWCVVLAGLVLPFLTTNANADTCTFQSVVCRLGVSIELEIESKDASHALDPIMQEHQACGGNHTDTRGMEMCTEIAIRKYRRTLEILYQAVLEAVDEKTKNLLEDSQKKWADLIENEKQAKEVSQNKFHDTMSVLGADSMEEQQLRQRIAQVMHYMKWSPRKELDN